MGQISDALDNVNVADFINDLFDAGFYHYVFPFLLVYAVVFTILKKVDIFKDKKPVQVIIALTFAIFAVSFPITGEGETCVADRCGQTLGDLMMVLFPGVTAFSIGVLALYIVVAMLGVDLTKFFGDENQNKWIKYILGGLGLIVVVYYYGVGFNWWNHDDAGVLDWLIGENTGLLRDPLLYILVLFGLLLWWIGKDDSNSSGGASSNGTTVNVGGNNHP